MSTRALASTISKQRESFPITSKEGELSLHFTQAQYLVGLIAAMPAKGAFAIHKTRLIAHITPQLQEWSKHHQDLMMEHALTELVDSQNPDGEKRLVRYSAADAAANAIPAGDAVGSSKFASPEARAEFIKVFEELAKELPVVVDTGANANLRKALTALHGALISDACPLVELDAVYAFERIVEEIETALAIAN